MTDEPATAGPRKVTASRVVIKDKPKGRPGGKPADDGCAGRHREEADAEIEDDRDRGLEAGRGRPTRRRSRREIVAETFAVDAPASGRARRGGRPGHHRRRARHGLGAELEALRTELDERTRDLQRVTAEYANYRKRVDRDRALVRRAGHRQRCSAALLPILDDLDRAREHGDLVGPFGDGGGAARPPR